MHVLVTGGCGYTGSVLVPQLLDIGFEVTVWDTQWFGNYLKPHPDLRVKTYDVREPGPMDGIDAIIHLANVANDPAGDLDPKLTWEVNALGMARLADKAVRYGVGQFIYASSGSVYGVSDAPQVTEETPLVPLTEYNKTKMVAERVLISYDESMAVQIIRPGTVCGVSPRQRLDITVNGMTIGALSGDRITVVNGEQNRPNIHIQDLANLYVWMLNRPSLVGIWNAGFENLRGSEIARIVAEYVPDRAIVESPSPDRRSYRMNSDKLLKVGFSPRHSVRDAVEDLVASYAAGSIKNEDKCFNLRVMRASAIA